MVPVSTLALEIELYLVPAAQGGWRTSLLGVASLESASPTGRTGVLLSSPRATRPGGSGSRLLRGRHPAKRHVLAVIVPLFPVEVPMRREVIAGDELRMYEGSRICGRG